LEVDAAGEILARVIVDAAIGLVDEGGGLEGGGSGEVAHVAGGEGAEFVGNQGHEAVGGGSVARERIGRRRERHGMLGLMGQASTCYFVDDACSSFGSSGLDFTSTLRRQCTRSWGDSHRSEPDLARDFGRAGGISRGGSGVLPVRSGLER